MAGLLDEVLGQMVVAGEQARRAEELVAAGVGELQEVRGCVPHRLVLSRTDVTLIHATGPPARYRGAHRGKQPASVVASGLVEDLLDAWEREFGLRPVREETGPESRIPGPYQRIGVHAGRPARLPDVGQLVRIGRLRAAGLPG